MSQFFVSSTAGGLLPPAVATSYVTDLGTAVPALNVLNINAGNAMQLCGATVEFTGSGNTVQLLVTDQAANTLIGLDCGQTTQFAAGNTGLGNGVLFAIGFSSFNTVVGASACPILVSGFNNAIFGFNAAANLLNGDFNTLVGSNAGSLYLNAESGNVIVGPIQGTTGESNTTRIGCNGVLSPLTVATYLYGIFGNPVSATSGQVVLADSTGLVGSISNGPAGSVLTSNGAGASPTYQTASQPPIGALEYFSLNGTNTTYMAPNWLQCNGAFYSQATYPTLFSRIGLINDSFVLWTTRTANASTHNINALTYGANFVYAGGVGVLGTSTDGITWVSRTSGTSSTINALTFGTNYVYGGAGGVLASSTDGVTWGAQVSGTTSSIQALAYGGGMYSYAGFGGVISSSTDAVTWTARSSPTTSTINALTYGNGIFLGAGQGGVMVTSTDAVTWTLTAISGTTSTIAALIYGTSFLAAGSGNGAQAYLASSTDGHAAFAQRTNTVSGAYNCLTYTPNLYLACGPGFSNIWTSTDSVTFTPNALPAAFSSLSLAYGSNLIVLAGSLGVMETTPATNPNPATQFAVPNDNNLSITAESQTLFKRALFIRAL